MIFIVSTVKTQRQFQNSQLTARFFTFPSFFIVVCVSATALIWKAPTSTDVVVVEITFRFAIFTKISEINRVRAVGILNFRSNNCKKVCLNSKLIYVTARDVPNFAAAQGEFLRLMPLRHPFKNAFMRHPKNRSSTPIVTQPYYAC